MNAIHINIKYYMHTYSQWNKLITVDLISIILLDTERQMEVMAQNSSQTKYMITNRVSQIVLLSTFFSIKSNVITSNYRETGVNVLALVNRF